MTGLLVAGSAVVGLAAGSFLNVVVWRVPRGESVVAPASACPRCGHPIRARDNIPVVSWLILRGRCRDCGAPINLRYPLVEAGTAAAFVLVAWWLGLSWQLPAFAYLAAVSVALALIDLDTRRLPDVIVLPSYPVAMGLLALAAWNPGAGNDWSAWVRSVAGAAILSGVYLLVVLVYPAGMGLGDVKTAGLVGLYLGWVGWGALAVGGFAAFLLGGVWSIALLLTGRAGRKTGIPFGPWILAGAWAGLLVGPGLWESYLALL